MFRALALALFLTLPLASFAQATALGVDPLTIKLSPRYPRPFEAVTLTPQTTLLNLAGSTVVVTADGREVGRGSGNQSYQIPTGAAGSATKVRVTVTGPDGTNTEDVVIRPADVTLVLDPISTAHPFYEGASLVAPMGRIRIVAITDLRKDPQTRLPDSGLVFTWKTGTRILQAESGLGKYILSATAPTLFRDTSVSLTVSSPDGLIVGEASVSVSPQEPSLLLYANNPLTGPDYAHAISGSYAMTDTEEAFRAVPYYFPSFPSLTWNLNGAFAGADPAVTVRSTGDSSGVASLTAAARQEGSYYEANQELRIRFGESERSGFFGL